MHERGRQVAPDRSARAGHPNRCRSPPANRRNSRYATGPGRSSSRTRAGWAVRAL